MILFAKEFVKFFFSDAVIVGYGGELMRAVGGFGGVRWIDLVWLCSVVTDFRSSWRILQWWWRRAARAIMTMVTITTGTMRFTAAST